MSHANETVYTKEARLGECMLLLASRDPSFSAAVCRKLEENGLSNGAQIIEQWMPDKYQHGLPIVGNL